MAKRYGTIGTISQVCDTDPDVSCGGVSSCDCDRITECLSGKCPVFTVAGLSDNLCTCCGEINTTFTGAAATPTECEYSGYAQNLFPTFSALGSYVPDIGDGDCCDSDVISSTFMGFTISLTITAVAIEVRLIVWGNDYPVYGDVFDFILDTDVDAAIESLCGGESVSVPFDSKVGPPLDPDNPVNCDMTGGSVTISFVDGCPPPPPVTGNCDDFLDCTDETQAFFRLWGDGLVARDDAVGSGTTVDGIGVTLVTRHWQDFLFNIVLKDVAFLPGGVIPDDGGRPAAGLDGGSSSMKRYWAPLGTFGDYSDPGLINYTDDFDNATIHGEGYLCGVVVEVECNDGVGVVSAVRFEFQNFRGHESATDPDQDWPPTDPFETLLSTPFGTDDPVTLGVPDVCAMSGMLSAWEYLNNIQSTVPQTGPLLANSFCIIGPLL